MKLRAIVRAFAALAAILTATSGDADAGTFTTRSMPSPPSSSMPLAVGASGGTTLLLTETSLLSLRPGASDWTSVGLSGLLQVPLSAAVGDGGVYCVMPPEPGSSATTVTRIVAGPAYDRVALDTLPPIPERLDAASSLIDSGSLHVTDGRRVWLLDIDASSPQWTGMSRNLPSRVVKPAMAYVQAELYVFGVSQSGDGIAYRFDKMHKDWQEIAGPPIWLGAPKAVAYGFSHVFFIMNKKGADSGLSADIFAYHTITDRYIDVGEIDLSAQGSIATGRDGEDVLIVFQSGAIVFQPSQGETNYGWLDNAVLVLYLLGMIGIGWYFARRENSANDYFRGGQRIPWWAAGMSLFATGASAISLAGMPGMGFGADWTYFTISIVTVVCLPIPLFIMAPLVRRLRISTANEYLERRFGLTSRLFASSVWIATQIAARIASVTLLSAIALEAITDLDIVASIVIIGVVTTLYTYLGGLEAVIWTDTAQGFVMVLTVLGCLILALVSLNAPPSELWHDLQQHQKLKTFDWDVMTWSKATTLIFFLHIFVFSFVGISDQNFVQRVQSTPSLKQSKLAVLTQMAVAVPINIILFSLGTVLWLFYRENPDSLSPTMINNDGIFPFFAAQQLPAGVSGIVVAALLAATMSTVSSGICSVSDLCTNDFYKRFKRDPTDRQVLLLGRLLTVCVGVFGTGVALILSQLEGVKSVWDLAIMVTGLISSSVIGLFLLGLISRRTHEVGALIGAAAGMLLVLYLNMYTDVTFWLFIVLGNLAAILVGIAASLVIPLQPKPTDGLTFYSLPQDLTPKARQTNDVETANRADVPTLTAD